MGAALCQYSAYMCFWLQEQAAASAVISVNVLRMLAAWQVINRVHGMYNNSAAHAWDVCVLLFRTTSAGFLLCKNTLCIALSVKARSSCQSTHACRLWNKPVQWFCLVVEWVQGLYNSSACTSDSSGCFWGISCRASWGWVSAAAAMSCHLASFGHC